MNSAGLRVSVILLCHDQLANLAGILAAPQAQTTRPGEVIIADDDSAEPIERFAADNGCQYVRTRHSAAFRNSGMRALARQLGTIRSRGDVIVYLDGDIIPSPGVIELILQLDWKGRGTAVKVPRRYHRLETLRVCPVTGWTTQPPAPTALFESFYSDCFAIRKEIVQEIGGWDTHFIGWGEEDVEFGFRCQEASVPLQFPNHPNGFTTHIDHPINETDKFSSVIRNLEYFQQRYPHSPLIRTYTTSARERYTRLLAELKVKESTVLDQNASLDSRTSASWAQCRAQLAVSVNI